MATKVETTQWDGQVEGIQICDEAGKLFKVTKAKLGTPATLEFRPSGIIITDNSDLGGMPMRIYGYSDVQWWHAGVGTFGMTMTGMDAAMRFVTDEVEVIRAEME